MTAMIGDSSPGASGTVMAWPRSADGEVVHGRAAEHTVVPGVLRRAQHRAQWSRQAIELAEPHHRDEEPTVAVACAVLGGAMAAQGRFEEARR
jgi:hypothetical protein